MNLSKKRPIVLGVDASNLNEGGGVTHLNPEIVAKGAAENPFPPTISQVDNPHPTSRNCRMSVLWI